MQVNLNHRQPNYPDLAVRLCDYVEVVEEGFVGSRTFVQVPLCMCICCISDC
jgi:hypothetical protein